MLIFQISMRNVVFTHLHIFQFHLYSVQYLSLTNQNIIPKNSIFHIAANL
uniref:Uncharacterized protein n=1 Tax=Anguilla anguilla TaxID=7936 RepID=A0A0E9QDZ7_ANGAN